MIGRETLETLTGVQRRALLKLVSLVQTYPDVAMGLVDGFAHPADLPLSSSVLTGHEAQALHGVSAGDVRRLIRECVEAVYADSPSYHAMA